ncbi:uncharacterized protein LOC118180516, partial [Stegodyphus dumicola]|uniref:uncharacterized protein LOC118180516 n=1 Tax=Stegodyphus dumicola TaxID=202533 RepID=UPI0015AE7BDF
VERYNQKKRPIQCYRCQEWGYSQHLCTNPERCCKCANSHRSKECPLRQDEAPTCIYCRENHVNSYRGCGYYRRKFEKKTEKKPTANPNEYVKIDDDFPILPSKAPVTPRRKIALPRDEKVKVFIQPPPDDLREAVSWLRDYKVSSFLRSMIDHTAKILAAKSAAEKLMEELGLRAAMMLVKFADDKN